MARKAKIAKAAGARQRTGTGAFEFSKQHEIEYQQICEHHRQGFRSMIEVARLYMLFQAGLAAALGFILTHRELQISLQILADLHVNVLVLMVSLVGLLAGLGAIGIARRVYLYHDATINRADGSKRHMERR